MAHSIPIINIEPLVSGAAGRGEVAVRIGQACREHGFFYVVGHGVDAGLTCRLERVSREFFAQELSVKLALRMERGGRAWRGYFPLGAELTSGQPDHKEGLYFAAELPPEDPRVRAGVPLHGPNLFPAIADFRETVLEYLAALTRLGHTLMRGIGLSLQLDEAYFERHYTADPLILFRIFHYPALLPATAASANRGELLSRSEPTADVGAARPTWSVGEHTDYGLLTILHQDDTGGLQVKSQSRWIPAPPIRGSFVCNIGDMLDRLTGGRYRSTPHRVRNQSNRSRLSCPFFFDPNFAAEVRPLSSPAVDDADQRWDRASVHALEGTYGDYIMRKVSRVFPGLLDAGC